MTTTLLEELVLLAYHDETGRNKTSYLDYGLAGAALMELALAERVDVQNKRLIVIDSRPLGDALIDEALATIAESKPRKPDAWVMKLTKYRARVIASLEDKGIVRREQDRLLGLVPFNRYLPVDGRTEAVVVAQLERLLDTGTIESPRIAAIASLIYAMHLEHVVFPDRKRSEVRKVLKGVMEGECAHTAVLKAVQATQAAIGAAILAATVAATAGGS